MLQSCQFYGDILLTIRARHVNCGSQTGRGCTYKLCVNFVSEQLQTRRRRKYFRQIKRIPYRICSQFKRYVFHTEIKLNQVASNFRETDMLGQKSTQQEGRLYEFCSEDILCVMHSENIRTEAWFIARLLLTETGQLSGGTRGYVPLATYNPANSLLCSAVQDNTHPRERERERGHIYQPFIDSCFVKISWTTKEERKVHDLLYGLPNFPVKVTVQSEYACCHQNIKIYTNTRAIFSLQRRLVLLGVGRGVADFILARVLTGVCDRSFTSISSGDSHTARNELWILQQVSRISVFMARTRTASHQSDSWKITIRRLGYKKWVIFKLSLHGDFFRFSVH